MSEERELPAELKAIEAELAALVPRTDGLDRERLIFLAGQASAQRATASRGGRAGGMTWPLATSAMTAVAASLLVVLVMRAEPEITTRVVYRYIPRPETVEDGSAVQVEPEASPAEAVPANPDRRDDSTLFRALAWIEFPDRERVRQETSHFRHLDRMLDQRAGLSADVLSGSTLRRPSSNLRRAAAPVTYQSLLDSVIEDLGPNTRQPDSSATETPNSSGVNS